MIQAPEYLCPNCHTITLCTVGARHCCVLCTVNFWCHILLCQIYSELLVQYIAVHSVRNHVGAIHTCAICTEQYWCHTLLCQLYVALLVPYIDVPSLRCTVGAIYCCANSTVHCWCHIFGVPFVCTAELFYCCQCAVLLKHVIYCSELSCLSVSTVLLYAVPFHLIPNFSNSPPKPDTLPHNVLPSTKWRAIAVQFVIQLCLQQNDKWSCELLKQQNYQPLISGSVQICSCLSVHSTHCFAQCLKKRQWLSCSVPKC